MIAIQPGDVYRERGTGLEFLVEVVQDCPCTACPSKLGPRESAGIAIVVTAHGQWKALTAEDLLDDCKYDPVRIAARIACEQEGGRS